MGSDPDPETLYLLASVSSVVNHLEIVHVLTRSVL
jgi:hypothetical protein